MAPAVNIFKDLVLKDLAQLPLKRIYLHSLPNAVLRSLCERKDLVIRPADKGGCIVVLDKTDYEIEMYRIFNDQDTYKELPNNPISSFKRELQDLITKGYDLNILNKKERAFLVPLAPRIRVMYYLPKIHKDPVHPPGRPIVSGKDSVTSHIGRYIDFYLQPLVRRTPSYLKDTGETIRLLEGLDIPGDYIWLLPMSPPCILTYPTSWKLKQPPLF